jgi:hypothetical protein
MSLAGAPASPTRVDSDIEAAIRLSQGTDLKRLPTSPGLPAAALRCCVLLTTSWLADDELKRVMQQSLAEDNKRTEEQEMAGIMKKIADQVRRSAQKVRRCCVTASWLVAGSRGSQEASGCWRQWQRQR